MQQWIVILLAQFIGACQPDTPDGPDALEKMAARGEHQVVLESTDAMLAATPVQDTPLKWTLDFRRRGTRDAIIGQRYIYFFQHLHLEHGDPHDPWPHLLPKPEQRYKNPPGYHQFLGVTCVDGVSGERLWTRYHTNDSNYTIHPEDDSLWLWPTRLPRPNQEEFGTGSILRVDPATGGLVSEQPMPLPTEKKHYWVRAIRVHDVLLWGREGGDSGGDPFVCEVDSGQFTQPAIAPCTVSPTGLRRVQAQRHQSPGLASNTLQLVPIGPYKGKPIWEHKTLGYSGSPPVWGDSDVLFLSGTQYNSHGIVYRIDGESGELKWRTMLSESAFVPGGEGFGISPPRYAWPAVGQIAGHVFAVGSHDTLFFLDPGNGTVVRRIPAAMPLLERPRLIGDALVLAGFDGIKAVRIDHVLGAANDRHLRLLGLRVRSLVSLGRLDEAVQSARLITAAYPGSARAWRALRDAYSAAKKNTPATAAEVRALHVSGEENSPWLRQSSGLVARIPTGRVTASLVQTGQLIIAGSQDGQVLTIDPLSGQVLDRQQVWTSISRWYVKGNTLYRKGEDRQEVPVGSFVDGTMQTPHDPRGGSFVPEYAEPKGMPREWYTINGYSGPPMRIGQRWVRTLTDGHVRISDGTTLEHYPPRVDGLQERWQIAVTEMGVLGYGTRGVYRLNENFQPVARIIDIGVDDEYGRARAVGHLTVVNQRIGLVVWGSEEQGKIQIWEPDGSKLIRETLLGSSEWSYASGGARLLPMGDGFLYSGGLIHWLPINPAASEWRFSIRPEDADPRRDSVSYDFGIPKVIGNRLVVPCELGGVYIFDTDFIEGRQRSR